MAARNSVFGSVLFWGSSSLEELLPKTLILRHWKWFSPRGALPFNLVACLGFTTKRVVKHYSMYVDNASMEEKRWFRDMLDLKTHQEDWFWETRKWKLTKWKLDPMSKQSWFNKACLVGKGPCLIGIWISFCWGAPLDRKCFGRNVLYLSRYVSPIVVQ